MSGPGRNLRVGLWTRVHLLPGWPASLLSSQNSLESWPLESDGWPNLDLSNTRTEPWDTPIS